MAGIKQEQIIIVAQADDGQRLDRWLKKAVPELPFDLSQKLIRKGAIRVDGKKMKGEDRINVGQSVRIPPIEDRSEREKRARVLTDRDRAYIESLVIYDDGDIIAFDKPCGLASQGGNNVEHHIDAYFPALPDRDGQIPRLIHRLDRDTSGVLLAARSAQAVRALGRAFRDRAARKIYWALTVPAPVQGDGTIRAPIIKSTGPIKDRMVIDDENGQGAVTDFVVLERAAKRAAFVAFYPRTGRTHQIRVHAADALQCPIIGDGKYGGADAVVEGEAGIADRLHLHARSLAVPNPFGKGELHFEAPLPPELRKSWKALGFDADFRGDPFAEGA